MASTHYTPHSSELALASSHYSPPSASSSTSSGSLHSSHQPPLFHPQPQHHLTAPLMADNPTPNYPSNGPYTPSSVPDDYTYADFADENNSVPVEDNPPSSPQGSVTTQRPRPVPALSGDDDRTPVVNESQRQIPPSSFPVPPQSVNPSLQHPQTYSQTTFLHALHTPAASGLSHVTSSAYAAPPLVYFQDPHTGQTFYTPYGAPIPEGMLLYQPPQHLQPPQTASHHFSNVPFIPVEMQQHPQILANQAYFAGNESYYNAGYTSQHSHMTLPGHHDSNIARSKPGSPSSMMSNASVTREASTSSRNPAKKHKLTPEDKRDIVKLHQSDSSLRQEDIARRYGVDRSTISKILADPIRWLDAPDPDAQNASSMPKHTVAKVPTGRFPYIEDLLDPWLDEQYRLGIEVKDKVLQAKAKSVARNFNNGEDKFKASLKWLDKNQYKERRKLAGKLVPSPSIDYNPYTATRTVPYNGDMMVPRDSASASVSSAPLSRSHSITTLSSSDSSGADFYPAPAALDFYQVNPTPHSAAPVAAPVVTPNRLMNRSDSNLVHLEMTPSSATRQRSQSSPQLLGEPGTQSPSSGRAMKMVGPRPSPLNLQRQNSYHGTSPSPRRPEPVTRANSAQITAVPGRRKGLTSLAASALGITPLGSTPLVGSEETGVFGSPLQSPSAISPFPFGGHSRQRSDVSLGNFTTSMNEMALSPGQSESSDQFVNGHNGPLGFGSERVPPYTPLTPGMPGSAMSSSTGVFANADYGALNGSTDDFGSLTSGNSAGSAHCAQGGPGGILQRQQQYMSMPNRHYGQYQQNMMHGHHIHNPSVESINEFGVPVHYGTQSVRQPSQ